MTVIPQDAEGLPVHWYIRVLSVYHVIILMQLWYQMYQCSWDAKKYQESTEINNLTLKCTFYSLLSVHKCTVELVSGPQAGCTTGDVEK